MALEQSPPTMQDDRVGWIVETDRRDIIAILDNAPIGIAINAPEAYEVLYINKACLEISGYTASEIPTGKDAGVILTSDPAQQRCFVEQMDTIAQTRHSEGLLNITCKDGQHKTVNVRAVHLPNNCIVSMWTDITRQVQAETELEARLKERTAGLVAMNEALRREVRNRKKVEKELERSREELRRLSEHIQCAREDERTHIAREVHDHLGQTLSALKIDVNCLGKTLPADLASLKQQTLAIEKQIDGNIQAVRNICAELRPPILSDFGLPAALEWYLEDFQKRTGIACRTRIEPGLPLGDKSLDLLFFRILQEALTNVMRHSGATAVTVSLQKQTRGVTLAVKDNGKGFARQPKTARRSFGLIGIRERVRFRGGRVRFAGIPGKGATLAVSIPVKEDRHPAGYDRTEQAE